VGPQDFKFELKKANSRLDEVLIAGYVTQTLKKIFECIVFIIIKYLKNSDAETK
jgi:hypothetical protein